VALGTPVKWFFSSSIFDHLAGGLQGHTSLERDESHPVYFPHSGGSHPLVPSVEPAGGREGCTARERDTSLPLVGMVVDFTESTVNSTPKKIHHRDQRARGIDLPKADPVNISSDPDSPFGVVRPCNNLAARGQLNVAPTEIYSDFPDEAPPFSISISLDSDSAVDLTRSPIVQVVCRSPISAYVF